MMDIPRFFMLLLLLLAVAARPAHAQALLRDAETESFLQDISKPIFEAAGLAPESVRFYLIADPSLNAFVAGGQNIFLHSGLLQRAETVDQLLGVIAHETGHISGGHLARMSDGAQEATAYMLLGLLASIGAVAAGAGEAGAAILTAGQSAAQGKFLAFTRVQESAADQAGAQFLDQAHVSGQGFLDFFNILNQQEQRYATAQVEYLRTHPLTQNRIARLSERVRASNSYSSAPNAAHQARFKRVQAKLQGYLDEPASTLRAFPASDTSAPAHLARAYAYHKQADLPLARAEVDALLSAHPDDAYALELKGQILLESGDIAGAIPPLRTAVRLAPRTPLIATLLGHALVAQETTTDAQEAVGVLQRALTQEAENPFAWLQLGQAYTQLNQPARAALASAERFSLAGDSPRASAAATQALAGLTYRSPDWVRAQDILLVNQQRMKDNPSLSKRHKG